MNAPEQIRATVDQLVDAWNRNDMDAFASLFTAEAGYVSGAGVWLRGREAIREELSDAMATGSELGRVILTNTSIDRVRTDVAIVHNTWEITPRTETAESRKGIITHVMVNDGERWRIAALQNTDVQGD